MKCHDFELLLFRLNSQFSYILFFFKVVDYLTLSNLYKWVMEQPITLISIQSIEIKMIYLYNTCTIDWLWLIKIDSNLPVALWTGKLLRPSKRKQANISFNWRRLALLHNQDIQKCTQKILNWNIFTDATEWFLFYLVSVFPSPPKINQPILGT